MTTTTLKATLQKSYYGKAKIFYYDDAIVLRSYNTDVIAIDKLNNKIIRLWAGWSRTTAKHINDFLMQNGFNALSKKDWLALPCLYDEPVYNICICNGFVNHTGSAMLTEREAINERDNIYNRVGNRFFVDIVEV